MERCLNNAGKTQDWQEAIYSTRDGNRFHYVQPNYGEAIFGLAQEDNPSKTFQLVV
jgi:hypothetical protein